MNPGAAPLRVAPPLGALGVAKALTPSTSLPRPSWESLEDEEPSEPSPRGELEADSPVAPDTSNTWRPARTQGLRALEDAEPELDALVAEPEEELDEALEEDGEKDDLAAEFDEELDGDEDDEDESEEEDEDGDEDEDDEEEDEDEDEEEEEEDEDSAWDDSEELEDEEEDEDELEEDEELEEDAAELEEWEEEDSDDEEEDEDEAEEEEDDAAELEDDEPELAAELEAPARPGSLSPVAAAEDGEAIEAELRLLLAEEDARTGAAPARAPVAADSPASAPARDALQMDLFESPRPAAALGSAAAARKRGAAAPASPAEADRIVLEPMAPPAASRRKPARTQAAQAAAVEEPRAAAAARAGDTPAEIPTQLLVDAGCLFLDRGRVAVSMLQKTFELDFDRSCEVLDQLQHMGLVGPYMGGQRRDILLTREQWLERIGQPSQGVQD